MQQEALERLHEMQKKSKTIVEPAKEAVSAGINRNPHQQSGSQSTASQIHNPPLPDIFKSILGDGIKLNAENALILMMLFVLYKNKADIKLLLALGYLLL